ncbi:hypothetical protein B0H66DRAFT_474009 [Apodospora peruviana]|uniref:Uncharacterized protein n=1 Tax=Apodospora peruviana TaxID=516989 RepID=A0AAE0ID07_9PEZI|nr:hypothetical protein B0H66DRAFT_474009 [Apodospora peruviana]
MVRIQLGIDEPKDKRQPRLPFPLEEFKGAYAGNGFNMIFRPRAFPRDKDGKLIKDTVKAEDGVKDNVLQVNLTTEQWTFGPTLGEIPNRGLENQGDINLGGLPYLQTVQDVTNEASGRGDRLPTDKPNGIHLEPGVFLAVPGSGTTGGTSIVRMASIPHGTTINAQGLAPDKNAKRSRRPDFNKHVIDTTPFDIGDPSKRKTNPKFFPNMIAERPNNELREPKDLSKFTDKTGGTGRITTEIIKNPNLVLEKATEGQEIIDTVTFSLSTGPSKIPNDPSLASHVSGGGGIANISFLKPNAEVELMTNTWWVETVLYDVKIQGPLSGGETVKEVWATMPEVSVPGQTGKKQASLAPTPVFSITAPPGGFKDKEKTLKVPGIQLQYSQTVNLNFKGLTWPHVSVATLVPTAPQRIVMKADGSVVRVAA